MITINSRIFVVFLSVFIIIIMMINYLLSISEEYRYVNFCTLI